MIDFEQLLPLLGVILGALIGGLFPLLGQRFAFSAEKRRDAAIYQDNLLKERLAPVYEFVNCLLDYTGMVTQFNLFLRESGKSSVSSKIKKQRVDYLWTTREEFIRDIAKLYPRALNILQTLESEESLLIAEDIFQGVMHVSEAVTLFIDGEVDFSELMQRTHSVSNSISKLTLKLDEYRYSKYSRY